MTDAATVTDGRAGGERPPRPLIVAFVAVLLAVAGCAPVEGPGAGTAEITAAGPRAPARAQRHMVAAAHPAAVEAGLEMLRAGGSAVDAAVAAQMVLGLVEPQSSGLGGGGFMMTFSARTGDIGSYDGRETAPAAATADMFLNDKGEPREFIDAATGGLSVGVPGLVRMLERVHRDHGRLPWARLFEPAIRLAREGFPVSPRLHALLGKEKHLARDPAAAAYFYTPSGEAKPVGAILVNEPYAETLRLIAEGGAEAFHTGSIARDIVAQVQDTPRNPGLMTEADLAGYQAKVRAPLCLPYRLWLVCGAPPPTSGGIATLQTMGILQEFDLGAVKAGSAEAAHLIAEASRLAFADRNAYVADSDFVTVPLAGLLDPRYLTGRAAQIARDHSMGTAIPGLPSGEAGRPQVVADDLGGVSTTHLSVVDDDGNAVALTSSIESVFGSRLMVRGFLLNNHLTDFSFRPTQGGVPVPNRVEPGKRPRSSMSPTLAFDGNGRLVLALGSPGGARIIGYVVATLVGVLDWGLDMQQAVELPHVVNRNGPTELESGTAAEALKAPLEARGHKVELRQLESGLHGIQVTAGGLVGGADPRREGLAKGD